MIEMYFIFYPMASQQELEQKIDQFPLESHQYYDALLRIGKQMVYQGANVKKNQKVLLWFDEPALPLVKVLYRICKEIGAELSFFERHIEQDVSFFLDAPLSALPSYFDPEKSLLDNAQSIFLIRAQENPEALAVLPGERMAIYADTYKSVHARRISGEVDWLLFYYPTHYDAKIENVSFDTYMQEVIQGCDLPWDKIAQSQQLLVEMLNEGKQLTFLANTDWDQERQTNVTMSIDGMSFVNSTIKSNFPGSEVFSAPVKESVQGQIFAEGSYLYDGIFMQDILLHIKNGKIYQAKAKVGNDGLQHILDSARGSRYFGEVAIGTNPALTRRFFNPLLNEKVGGSFHMAIGHCYTLTEDEYHHPVIVNNGNTMEFTPVHWDLAILMHRNGKIILDGKCIQENGLFLDPRLVILNRMK